MRGLGVGGGWVFEFKLDKNHGTINEIKSRIPLPTSNFKLKIIPRNPPPPNVNNLFIHCLCYILDSNKTKEKMYRWIYSLNPLMLYLPITFKSMYFYCLCTCLYPKVLLHGDYMVYISSSHFKMWWFTIYMFTAGT